MPYHIVAGAFRLEKNANAIYNELLKINNQLISYQSSLKIYHGNPLEVFKQLSKENPELEVYTNRDYEPYAIARDEEINKLLMTGILNLKEGYR